MFFVSQKPYSVTGTLLDQVLYPECLLPPPADGDEDAAVAKQRAAAEEDAMALLRLVGIDYLVERWADGEGKKEGDKEKPGASGWYATKAWEATLSLGEQQRMGMARMFHKRPDFAVLDECTDAVSVDVERRLYAACVERGVNCVTISKRLTLEEYHEKELRLGEVSDAGFSVSDVVQSPRARSR